jgi:hypothetical protein
MPRARASTLRSVVVQRDGSGGGKVVRPRAFQPPPPPPEPVDLTPYDISAAGLEEAILQAQLERLNLADQTRARRHLGLVPNGPADPTDDLQAAEKAVAKMRHPSVARVWKLRSVPRPGRPPSDN